MSNTATQNHPDLTLSIIIVSWNACELLATCVQSIYDNLDVPQTEVIVVDNGSDDGSPRWCRRAFRRCG
ncbi:MAG: glycosyltransferase [Anaerolineae bacterium]|nr:glycosyltransferase [Anaerolineae bacterium]